MVALDALGKLQDYAGVFNIEMYNKNKKNILKNLAWSYGYDVFARDSYDFCKANGIDVPSLNVVVFQKIFKRGPRKLVRIIKEKLNIGSK